MEAKCLLIADDLTGGADSGAQFAKRGLSTLLISLQEHPHLDLSRYLDRSVLAVNTDSRGLKADRAFDVVSGLLKSYKRELFPVTYKKIDSTLRGNIGYEIDAILKATGIPMGFMAPTFPEQNRTLVGGIMMVAGRPLSLTEASRDTVSPVKESHVQKLLRGQSGHKIGKVDLVPVASSPEQLKKAVNKEYKKGSRIIVFDAVERHDLARIVEAGFSFEEKPLFIGSAGLAEEVARKLAGPQSCRPSFSYDNGEKPVSHILVVSGSASKVTHEQLNRIERGGEISSFELTRFLILSDETKRQREAAGLSLGLGDALARGHALLKSCSERLENREGTPIHLDISRMLGQISLAALERAKVDRDDLALILVGGDTARSVFSRLGFEGLEIITELMDGVILSRLIGGKWSGLRAITKAGAFGKEDTLEKMMTIVQGRRSPDL